MPFLYAHSPHSGRASFSTACKARCVLSQILLDSKGSRKRLDAGNSNPVCLNKEESWKA